MIRTLKHPRMQFILALFALMVVVGVFAFSHLEGWSLLDSLYFTVTTLTTVGYGDHVPVTDAGKLLAVIYMVLVVPMILIGIGVIAEGIVLMTQKKKK